MKSHEQEIQELKKRIAELEQKVGSENKESKLHGEFNQICAFLTEKFGQDNIFWNSEDWFEASLQEDDGGPLCNFLVNVSIEEEDDDQNEDGYILVEVYFYNNEFYRVDARSSEEFFQEFSNLKSAFLQFTKSIK